MAVATAEHLTRPPSRHVGEHWDITFMELGYDGHQIELGGSDDVRIRDGRTGVWVEQHIDYARAQVLEVEGAVWMPVMPRNDLIAYKRLLDRPVPRERTRPVPSVPRPSAFQRWRVALDGQAMVLRGRW